MIDLNTKTSDTSSNSTNTNTNTSSQASAEGTTTNQLQDTKNTTAVRKRKAEPKRETGFGYFTERGRQLWIKQHPKEAEDNKEYIDSLNYNPDETKPLYFWQLYSLMGTQRIVQIITVFYTSVFEDKNEWFVEAFTDIGPLEHHIRTQSQFWLDAFGRGRQYHGGEFRLNYHHKFNAPQVMNHDGAKQWMYHMRKTLNSNQIDLTDDKRVRPAINEFLKIMMDKYGYEFDFKTDDIKYE